MQVTRFLQHISEYPRKGWTVSNCDLAWNLVANKATQTANFWTRDGCKTVMHLLKSCLVNGTLSGFVLTIVLCWNNHAVSFWTLFISHAVFVRHLQPVLVQMTCESNWPQYHYWQTLVLVTKVKSSDLSYRKVTKTHCLWGLGTLKRFLGLGCSALCLVDPLWKQQHHPLQHDWSK